MRASILAFMLLAACSGPNPPESSGNDRNAVYGQYKGEDGIRPDNMGSSRTYPVGTFQRISTSSPEHVIVTVGGRPSVTAEGDPEVLDEVVIRVMGDTLSIGRRDYLGVRELGRATIRVTVPALAGVNIFGSGDMRVSPLRAQTFRAALPGTGSLTLDRLEAENAEFVLTGAGDVQASGRVRQANIQVAGAPSAALGISTGAAALDGLEAGQARIYSSGAGAITIRATGTADIELRGPGNVTVTGGARCHVNRSGPGEVHCD